MILNIADVSAFLEDGEVYVFVYLGELLSCSQEHVVLVSHDHQAELLNWLVEVFAQASEEMLVQPNPLQVFIAGELLELTLENTT